MAIRRFKYALEGICDECKILSDLYYKEYKRLLLSDDNNEHVEDRVRYLRRWTTYASIRTDAISLLKKIDLLKEDQ